MSTPAMDGRSWSRSARRGQWDSALLTGLLCTTAVLLVYEILRANNPKTLTVHLLGVPTTAALFTTVAIGLQFRRQFARSRAPLLRYVSRWVSTPERSLAFAEKYWQVRIGNAGNGAAVIERVAFVEPGATDGPGTASADELLARAGEQGSVDVRDYWVANYTPGMALAPGEERCYFECTDATVAAFSRLEVNFEFRSMLGERFEKRVSLVPHAGASEVVLDSSSR
jgi:hypothetical protein